MEDISYLFIFIDRFLLDDFFQSFFCDIVVHYFSCPWDVAVFVRKRRQLWGLTGGTAVRGILSL